MKLQKQQVMYIIIPGVIILIVLTLGYFFWSSIGSSGGAEEFPISWFIIIAAILGSIVNQPFRSEESMQKKFGGITGYIFWKCLVSIVLAFALNMMFIGGFLSGDIFPQFINTTIDNGGQYSTMIDFATKVDPLTNKDVAKILIWSFIAGYSEKFVPNLICNSQDMI